MLARLAVGWLCAATAAFAQPQSPPPPATAAELVAECRQSHQREPWADCDCYARKVLELRRSGAGDDDQNLRSAAHHACPDRTVIEARQRARCLDQRVMRVPRAIDAEAWCGCYAAEYTRQTLAHAPRKHEAHTESDFMNRSNAHCTRAVKTPTTDVARGLDLSGPWRFVNGDLELDFSGPAGRWTESRHEEGGQVRHFRHVVSVAGFSAHVAAATASMHQHPRTQHLLLTLDGEIPYLRARRCEAAEVSTSRIVGRCTLHGGGTGDAGPFTLRRPGPGEAAVPEHAGSTGTSTAPAPTPPTAPAPTASPASPPTCPGGGALCATDCLALLRRPSLDVAQRVLQCHQACKANCGS